MTFDIREFFTATMILFAVIDIIGSIPIVIELRNKMGHIHSERASAVAGVIMLGFLVGGEGILNIIGVDVNSFAVAGSFVLLFMALEMILGIKLYRDDEPQTASIVPLAFPLIAGAGSMTSIISLRAEFDLINIAAAIVVNIVFVYLVLKSSKKIESLLGKAGIAVIRKVFGIILLAIAVKLFASNAKLLFI